MKPILAKFSNRRHDLDALRATAMLWRQRGLKSLLWQRFQRVFLPLLLGLLTIVPALNWISAKAISSASRSFNNVSEKDVTHSDLWTAAKSGDVDIIDHLIEEGAKLDELDSRFGWTPLFVAVTAEQAEAAELLLARGADINGNNRDGATPLHGAVLYACVDIVELLLKQGADVNLRNQDGSTALHLGTFLGRVDAVERLLVHDADPTLRNGIGQTAIDVAAVDWGTSQLISRLLGLQIDRAEVMDGRAQITQLLGQGGERKPAARVSDGLLQAHDQMDGEPRDAWMSFLKFTPVFHHLWFLWFLCWLVLGFALCAMIMDQFSWRMRGRWLLLSPIRFLWLIPLTMVPQWFMGAATPNFGPDTTLSILPSPRLLFYYAIFFGVGALYFDSDDTSGQVGHRWWITGPVALLLVFPLGLASTFGQFGVSDKPTLAFGLRFASVALQVSYAWMMTTALMGFFRCILTTESKLIRYLSDASYWLYVAHLPLMVAAQWLVRDWPLHAIVKFILVCLSVTGILLVTYQFMVRYTWLGRLLNGPRSRSRQKPISAVPQHCATSL